MDIGPSAVLPCRRGSGSPLREGTGGRAPQTHRLGVPKWGTSLPFLVGHLGPEEARSELRFPPRPAGTGLQRRITSCRQAAGGMAGPGCHRARVPHTSRWWGIPEEVGTWFPARCPGPRAWGWCWMCENSSSGCPAGTFHGERWTPAPSRLVKSTFVSSF